MTRTEYADLAARANAGGKILVPDGNGSYRLETPPLVPPHPEHYSKLSLIRALKSAGLWAEVKSAIVAADAMDEWDAATFLAEDDPLFCSLRDSIAAGHPDVDLTSLLKTCIY